MKKSLLVICLLGFVCSSGLRPVGPDKSLEKKLKPLLNGFRGQAGLYVYHFRHKREVAIWADSIFPTASMIKVPILAALFDRVEKGELGLDSLITFRDSLRYTDKEILGSLRDSAKIPIGEVAMLSITTSDNTAALWCQQLSGTGTGVNTWLENNGFKVTRVNSRTPGREKNKEKYGWGQTSPREMVKLLTAIYEGRLISSAASEQLYRFLSRIYWDGEALSQIPPQVQTISKQGAVDRSRSEVVLVNAPHGTYAFCLITKNQQDITYERNNEGFVLLRKVSRAIWEHYEPEHPWKPADENTAEKWYK